MNPNIRPADISSERVQAAMHRNQYVARKAMQLIAKKHSRKSPEDALEAIAQTVGTLAAEMVYDYHSWGGKEVSLTIRDLIILYIDQAVTAINEEGKNV